MKEKVNKGIITGWPFKQRLRFLLIKLLRRLNYEAGIAGSFGDLYDFYLNLRKRGGTIIRQEQYFRVLLDSTGCYIREGSSDLDVFNQVYLVGEYTPLLDVIRINRLPVTTIIDAGANIGLTSLLLNRTFPNAKIISVEPDKGNFEMLRRNLAESGGDSMIAVYGGVSPVDGNLVADHGFRDAKEWSRAFLPGTESIAQGVPGYTVSSLMKKFDLDAIDLLKIDIEGGERFLFGDDPHVYDFLKQVNIICMEIHDEFHCRPRIYEILRAAGFQLVNAGELSIGVKKDYWFQ